MPDLCNVTGFLRDLEGNLLPDTQLRLQRFGVKGQDDTTVIPYDFEIVSSSVGYVNFDAFPGNYIGHVIASGRNEKFSIAVPFEDQADFSTTIDAEEVAFAASTSADMAAASAAAAASSAVDAGTSEVAASLSASSAADSATLSRAAADEAVGVLDTAIINTTSDVTYGSVSVLIASSEPSRAVGAIWVVDGSGGRFSFEEVASGGAIANAAGVEFLPITDGRGRLHAEAFNIKPAASLPTPTDNATQFQAWVNSHAIYSTIELPAWDIPLGAGINFGARNVSGQGDASKLIMSGLDATEDAITISGGNSGGGAGERAGKLKRFSVDCQGVGQDAIRWTGGIGCRADGVTVIEAGRDGFHFEQDANTRYFERAALDDCNLGQGAGRYGLCLALTNFGSDDSQFINKSLFSNSKMVGCEVADVGILLGDADGAGSDTKVGGGLKFDNFHAQFQGAGPNRLGCAIYVERAATSSASVDWMKFEDSTFEWNGGSPDANGALMIVDNAGGNSPVTQFFDESSLLTGYTTWWDYNGPSPIASVYSVRTPLQGLYTNAQGREFGTRSDRPGGLSVPAGGATFLFSATETGPAWMVSARLIGSAGGRATSVVYGHSTPRIDSISQAGNLTLGVDGAGNVVAENSGGSSINIFWGVQRIVS